MVPVRPGRLAVQGGQAAHALDDVVERRLVLPAGALAEAGGRGMDQPRMLGRKRGIIQPQPRGGGDAHVVHQHVGAGDQPLQRRPPGRAFEVQHHAALVAVEVDEVGRHVV
jgi:hypothetical protein